jgi:RNA polymerase nonessential primary-like sigma factor
VCVGEDKDTSLSDFIIDYRQQPAKLAEKYDLTRQVYQMLQSLSAQHRGVIIRRFGLFTHERDGEKTLEQIGQYLGVTRERVRQIQVQAMKKLEKQRYYIDFGSL